MLLLCCLLQPVFENFHQRPPTWYELKSLAPLSTKYDCTHGHQADSPISTRRDLRRGSIRRRVGPSAHTRNRIPPLQQCAPVFESLSKKLLLQYTNDYTRLSTINLLLRTYRLAAIWSHLPTNTIGNIYIIDVRIFHFFSLLFCHPRHRLPSVLAFRLKHAERERAPTTRCPFGVRTSRQGGHRGLCLYCLEKSSTYRPGSHADIE